VQELLQFAGKAALGSVAHEGFERGNQIAPTREPDLAKGPKAMSIKPWDLVEGIEATAVGIAGTIGKFFQLAKHGAVDVGAQGLFQLRQGGDFLRAQELAQVIGEERRSSHNAKVPPPIGYLSGTIAEWRMLRPAVPERVERYLYWPKTACGSRGSTRGSQSQLIE
jgi:hypothetical protein